MIDTEMVFPGGSAGKEFFLQCRCERCSFSPWVGDISPGGENGNPLLYFCLKNPMDKGVWRATVQGVTKSRTLLSTHSKKTQK